MNLFLNNVKEGNSINVYVIFMKRVVGKDTGRCTNFEL